MRWLKEAASLTKFKKILIDEFKKRVNYKPDDIDEDVKEVLDGIEKAKSFKNALEAFYYYSDVSKDEIIENVGRFIEEL